MTKPHLNKVAVIFIAGKCLILHLTETINVDFKLNSKEQIAPPSKHCLGTRIVLLSCSLCWKRVLPFLHPRASSDTSSGTV